MTTFLLSAVGCTRRETSVALAANHLVAVGDGSQLFERWLNDATSIPRRPEISFNRANSLACEPQTEDQVKGRLLLDVVV